MKSFLSLSSFIFLSCFSLAQPLTSHPYSTQAEIGYTECRDTISLLRWQRDYDIGLILPSWLPIIDKNYVAVLEGKVAYNLADGSHSAHVSHEDLPFYHYSHDMDFDVIPDPTDDHRFTNYLPYLVYQKKDGNDTVLDQHVHVEWECGLGMVNRVNPLRSDNDYGKSGGFFSAGHELGDILWNWPTMNDWVHVEGNYIWDRGHPPAEAEIHPARFVLTKRQLPEQIMIGDSSLKFATRVDVFASGDGGALTNNRYNAPDFVQRVNMSAKDYTVHFTISLPRPSPNAHLRYTTAKRKGDNFSAEEIIEINDDSSEVTFTVPWKSRNANDLEIYARSFFFFWDEGRGIAQEQGVDIYKVKLDNLRFRYMNDKLSKAEVRLFANVGSHWIFLNDFFPKRNKILSKGLGKTRKKKWTLNNEFTVYVPRGKSFRVYMSGWEVDGVDLLSGELLDPNSGCNRKTKNFIKNRIFSISNMLFKGCMDDEYGEISKLHGFDNLGRIDHFTNSPNEGFNDDPCPFSKYPLKDRYFLSYTIEKVN